MTAQLKYIVLDEGNSGWGIGDTVQEALDQADIAASEIEEMDIMIFVGTEVKLKVTVDVVSAEPL